MPSKPSRGKASKSHRAAARKPVPKKPARKAAPPRPSPKAKPAKPVKPKPEPEVTEVPSLPRTGDARRHLLSLSFVRDGDEFMARLETDAGQITELKNRFLDQLLTLVANELEDILE
jgi:hypothetical protein